MTPEQESNKYLESLIERFDPIDPSFAVDLLTGAAFRKIFVDDSGNVKVERISHAEYCNESRSS